MHEFCMHQQARNMVSNAHSLKECLEFFIFTTTISLHGKCFAAIFLFKKLLKMINS
jgi:hypothetical protein